MIQGVVFVVTFERSYIIHCIIVFVTFHLSDRIQGVVFVVTFKRWYIIQCVILVVTYHLSDSIRGVNFLVTSRFSDIIEGFDTTFKRSYRIQCVVVTFHLSDRIQGVVVIVLNFERSYRMQCVAIVITFEKSVRIQGVTWEIFHSPHFLNLILTTIHPISLNFKQHGSLAWPQKVSVLTDHIIFKQANHLAPRQWKLWSIIPIFITDQADIDKNEN